MKLTREEKQRRDDLAAAARQAEKDERWGDMCLLWQECFVFEAKPAWRAAYAKSLVALNRFDEAARVYDALERDAPNAPLGLAGKAQLAATTQHFHAALAHWDTLKAGFPDAWKPAWEARRAQALFRLGRVEEAERAFAALAEADPEDPAGLLGLAAAADVRRDRPGAAALWQRIEAAFPDDRKAIAARIKHELQRGKIEEAALRLSDAPTLPPDERAVLEADLLFMSMRYAEAIDRVAGARDDRIKPARLWAKELQIRAQAILVPEDTAAFAAAAAAAAATFPQSGELREVHARALIVDGRAGEANAVIAALGPPSAGTRDGLWLASWSAHAQGRVEEAVALASQALERSFVASLHANGSVPSPAVPAGGGRTRAEVALFSCVKNEVDYLPWFLDYYRRLGVERFVMIDNGSTDGSRELLAADADVDLFDARGDFFAAGGGMRWINHLMAEHPCRWAVYVDTDEMLVFPDSETRPLADWLAEVGRAGQEAVPGFMVDLYGEAAAEAGSGPIADPLATTPFYDTGYFRFGALGFPYFEIGGGPRSRLFSTYEHLRKVPVTAGDRAIRYLNSHSTTPARLGPHGCLLLHFKLLRQARAKRVGSDPSRLASRSQGAIERHGRYEQMLADSALHGPGTVRYGGTRDASIRRLFDLVASGAGGSGTPTVEPGR